MTTTARSFPRFEWFVTSGGRLRHLLAPADAIIDPRSATALCGMRPHMTASTVWTGRRSIVDCPRCLARRRQLEALEAAAIIVGKATL